MSSKEYIQIKNINKIFGPNPESVLDLVANGVGKSELQSKYNHILALQDINIGIKKNKIQVFMGLSGSGKSTLIRHLNQLIHPTSGNVIIDGEDVTSMSDKEITNFRRNKIAMVFQKFALLPHRTVLSNTYFGLEIRGVEKKEREKEALKWIDRVGLNGFENYYPNQLSGGMQQRVGLARALTNDAPILLMDEPFSALDPLIRMDMQDMLVQLEKELNKTIVFITHDLDEALRLGDNIAILRDGKIIQEGDGQDIVLNPENSYISKFVSEVNRGRVIQCKTIMKKTTNQELTNEAIVSPDMTIEEAAKIITESGLDNGSVLNDKGKLVGTISVQDIVASIVTPIKYKND